MEVAVGKEAEEELVLEAARLEAAENSAVPYR